MKIFWMILLVTQSMFIIWFIESTRFFLESATFFRSLFKNLGGWSISPVPDKFTIRVQPCDAWQWGHGGSEPGSGQNTVCVQVTYKIDLTIKKVSKMSFRFDPIDLARGVIAGRRTSARLSSKQVNNKSGYYCSQHLSISSFSFYFINKSFRCVFNLI